ncbi:hypothetical protein RRG08_050267 [Elysia crispata]|uniref:Uncharacterized protein n=1 Tax=Elysia crispata TaxID=231223 RepID=A0AAE1B3L1_9GAST|nr:hypothetical protein RRG08_050267 [Elysia crispata]
MHDPISFTVWRNYKSKERSGPSMSISFRHPQLNLDLARRPTGSSRSGLASARKLNAGIITGSRIYAASPSFHRIGQGK